MRAILRTLARIIGVALFVFGVMWALQGLGILNWPAESMMLANSRWALYGAICAGVGLTILALDRRAGR